MFESNSECESESKIIFAKTSSENTMDISELSPEQKYTYQKFTKGENIFITGPGGTGKTRLIKHLINYSKSIGKQIDVCALTGCAAILLNCNATTIHSWSGIKLAKGTKTAIISAVLRNKFALNTWKKSKGIILDEVSMLSQKIFEILEELGRIIKKSSLPFGGMQVVFSGDFFQLPPIGTDGEPETENFCFESPIWNRVFKKENMIELKTMFRQKDPQYIEILKQIRVGNLSEENKKILQTYVQRNYEPEKHNGCTPTKLFSIRSKVDYINNMMFSKIDEPEFVFEITRNNNNRNYLESLKPIESEIMYKCSQMNIKDIEYETESLINNTPSSKILRLKKGAVVMCIVNLDMQQSICNGSQGIVIDIIQKENKSIPIVRFSNGVVKPIEPYHWQSENYPTISIGQIPLCLAWAMTIHKIQGSTLSIAEMDIGQSIFEYGQTYVALSRIQSLEGLYLSAFHADKIKANPKVIDFYNSIPELNISSNNPQPTPTPTPTLSPSPNTNNINFSEYEYNPTYSKTNIIKVVKKI